LRSNALNTVLPADQPWKKQGLFGCWIEPPRYRRFTGGLPNRGGKSRAGELFEALFRLDKRFYVVCIKVMASVAIVVHDDLSGHCKHSLGFAPIIKMAEVPERFPTTDRNTFAGGPALNGQTVFGKTARAASFPRTARYFRKSEI
jgi:hypothetical protein